MKLLSTFQTLTTITSSGATAGYPASNIANLDPGLIWQSSAYAGDVWLKVDFGSAKSLTALFLNRANFPQCRIQGHASDSWASPSFNSLVSLVQDGAGNRKGWFDLAAFNYQWLRILIPGGQTLDNSDTLPELGNLIVGTSADLPTVAEFQQDLVTLRADKWLSDGGTLRKNYRGNQAHQVTVDCSDTLANVRAAATNWTHGVLYADLENAGESWLVYRPERWGRPVKNTTDAGFRMTFEERV